MPLGSVRVPAVALITDIVTVGGDVSREMVEWQMKRRKCRV